MEEYISEISRYFTVIGYREVSHSQVKLEAVVEPKSDDIEKDFDKLYEVFSRKGLIPILFVNQGLYIIRIIDNPGVFSERNFTRRILPIILFVVTLFTVYIAGIYFSESFRELTGFKANISYDALLYTLSLMSALVLHELSHYTVARFKKTPVSAPYFIPAPPLNVGFIGTFGAVINMRLPPTSVNSLALIGIAGPLASFLVAIPVTILGVSLSEFLAPSQIAAFSESLAEIRATPLAMRIIIDYMVPKNMVILSHPVLLAAYFLFLITFLNLLPIGQLDGGHVIRALTDPHTHRTISISVIVTLIPLGFLLSSLVDPIYSVLSFFSILAFFLTARREHVGVLNLFTRLDRKHYWIPLLYIILLVFSMPVPG